MLFAARYTVYHSAAKRRKNCVTVHRITTGPSHRAVLTGYYKHQPKPTCRLLDYLLFMIATQPATRFVAPAS